MKYGLIGGRLSHSFSPEIHNRLDSNPYLRTELKEEELKPFLEERDFIGINVTIPYKTAVIPYLDALDPIAKEIGAVNTVVNRNGKLTGYNTDFFGMKLMFERFSLSVKDKTVAVLGTGGTSMTAMALCKALGAKAVYRTSRYEGEGVITYGELYSIADKIEIIINTTPVGMYPDIDGCPVDIDKFPTLSGVADVIYNPLRSALLMKAEKRGICVASGLYMLVAQGLIASEKFLEKEYGGEKLDGLYSELLSKKESIVLIGMPSSGKSTVGKRIAELLGREFIDTDKLIADSSGREISEIFAEGGEPLFREIESAAIKEAAKKSGAVIATGGGAVLREENIERLKRNGRIFFLDRAVEELAPTPDRPLALNKEAIYSLYEKRYPLYEQAADVIVVVRGNAEDVAKEIIGELKK